MHKRLTMLAMASLLLTSAHAQDASRATTEAIYLATCIKDTVAGKVLTDTFRLRYNADMALFYSEDKFRSDSLRLNNRPEWEKQVEVGMMKGGRADKAGLDYYILADVKQQTYTYKGNISANAYRYTDSLPTFNWQLLPEHRTIAGHKCAKAVGRYMGRTYEAWYATDIPARLGPWKFYGLPGLVLHVYDTRRQYAFTFLGIVPCTGAIALFPSRTFKTTKEKFLKEYDFYLADPVGYLAKNTIVRVEFGSKDGGIPERMRNESRHRPMEILE